MSAGTLSKDITAQACNNTKKPAQTMIQIYTFKDFLSSCLIAKLTPAFSATLASSAVVTSIIIPPLAICANPALTLKVPVMETK